MARLPKIILASTSPQRIQILQELGISFTVAKKVTEEVLGATPSETVTTNAKLKALDVLGDASSGLIIVAADTVLSQDGKIFGKPENEEAARKMLRGFSSRQVQVFSGVAAVFCGESIGWVTVETAEIEFIEFSEEIIDWYVNTGEPLTRAGSIGINRIGEILTNKIWGSYSCIAGLPKRSLLAILDQLNVRYSGPKITALFKATNIEITPFSVA